MTTPPVETMLLTPAPTLSGSIGIERRRNRSRILTDPHTAIVPTVIANPYSVDNGGIAYPAGLVAAYCNHAYTESETTLNQRLVLVPAELPSGYLHRWRRDLVGGTAQGSAKGNSIWTMNSFSASDFVSAATSTHRLRSDAALTPYTYLPANQGNQARADVYGLGVPNSTWLSWGNSGWSTATPGFRYFRGRAYHLTDGSNAITLTFQIRYNADGSTSNYVDPTYGTIRGDSILASWSWVMPYSPPTQEFDTGMDYSILFPIGTKYPIYFELLYDIEDHFSGVHTIGGGGGLTWRTAVQAGPRVDIPFPWTITGTGLIAPGGVIPGVVPGYP